MKKGKNEFIVIFVESLVIKKNVYASLEGCLNLKDHAFKEHCRTQFHRNSRTAAEASGRKFLDSGTESSNAKAALKGKAKVKSAFDPVSDPAPKGKAKVKTASDPVSDPALKGKAKVKRASDPAFKEKASAKSVTVPDDPASVQDLLQRILFCVEDIKVLLQRVVK